MHNQVLDEVSMQMLGCLWEKRTRENDNVRSPSLDVTCTPHVVNPSFLPHSHHLPVLPSLTLNRSLVSCCQRRYDSRETRSSLKIIRPFAKRVICTDKTDTDTTSRFYLTLAASKLHMAIDIRVASRGYTHGSLFIRANSINA